MTALLFLLTLPIFARSQSLSSCGAAGDHFKDVKITLSPDPINKGTPFTIDVSGNLDTEITAMNFDIDLHIKALGIIDEPVKVSSPFSISPGLVAGPQKVSIGPLSLPSLPGSLEVVGTVKMTNDKKEPVACINLNLNVPAEETKDLQVEGSNVSVCSGASDHLHNLAWTTSSDQVTTITGTLDEAVTKLAVNVDLKLSVGVLPIPIKLAVPVSYSPGLAKGDLKITVGPPPSQPQLKSFIDVDVTGTIKLNDGASEEITCLSLTKADAQPNLVTV
jgi:hypothetical protein